MPIVALYTVALLRVPYDEPQSVPLRALLEPVWAAAEAGSGFVALSRHAEFSEGREWGPLVLPMVFRKPEFERRIFFTLSLWEDIEAAYAFAYNGLHRIVFVSRREWFVPTVYPNYAAWWVADHHTPTWAEGSERYDWLQQHGPGSTAFNFTSAYSADGKLIHLRQEVIAEHARRYADSKPD